MRMLLGLATPDEGEATILGRPYRVLDRPMSMVGALIDGAEFHPARTARRHLGVLAAAGGLRDARIDEVLARVELSEAADRKVGTFSLGMRRRLGLGAALLGDPEVLVLDEPANGLDPPGIRWLRHTLRQFAADGGTVFVSSHVLAEVARTADEVVVLNRGRLVTQTAIEGLVSGSVVTVRTSEPERLRRALVAVGGVARATSGDRLEVTGVQQDEVGRTAARESLVVFELATKAESLEDAFLELINERKGELHVAS